MTKNGKKMQGKELKRETEKILKDENQSSPTTPS